MVAAPQYFTTSLAMGNIVIPVDCYASDVADALTRWDGGSGAGAATPEEYVAPAGGRIVDMLIVTGMTDTTKMECTVDGKPIGAHIRYACIDDGLPRRPSMAIPFGKGSKIRFMQKA